MKIAIKFGDNDFYHMWYGVLTVLAEAYKYSKRLPIEKTRLCIIINKLVYGCYLAFQNQFEYNNEGGHGDGSYYQINEDQILIDHEVDEYLKETSWDNSETFVLSIDDYHCEIWSV